MIAQALRLSCPQCGRRLTAATQYTSATINVKRKCRKCATWWSITIEPLAGGARKGLHFHKATFTAYEPAVREVR